MSRLNIFFVVGSLDLGGAENQLTLLIQHLRKIDHICTVFSLQGEGILKKKLAQGGVSLISGGFKKGDLRRAPWKLIPAQIKLIKAIYRIKPQIIHAYLPLTSFLGVLAGRIFGKCIVITSRRALGKHQDRFPFFKPFDMAANLMSHCITVNSLAVKKDLLSRERIGDSRIVLIYNGIDIDRFRADSFVRRTWRSRMGVSDTQKVIIFVANLIPYKGHKDFLHAASMVVSQHPDVRFWLVGEDRGLQPELEQLAQRLNITIRVSFLGQRLDIAELLTASDILVLASHEEGFSNVILEAMATGLPVIATQVGGNSEAVVTGETGWLCPAGNPSAMALKMMDLLQDSEKALDWGQNGKNRVKSLFSVERLISDHLALYRRLLAETKESRN